MLRYNHAVTDLVMPDMQSLKRKVANIDLTTHIVMYIFEYNSDQL